MHAAEVSVRQWNPVKAVMAVAIGAAVYGLERVLAVPAGAAFVDATLVAFVTLLVLGWRRG
jgi:hypothetical protein